MYWCIFNVNQPQNVYIGYTILVLNDDNFTLLILVVRYVKLISTCHSQTDYFWGHQQQQQVIKEFLNVTQKAFNG
jgi:hypothetical protein